MTLEEAMKQIESKDAVLRYVLRPLRDCAYKDEVAAVEAALKPPTRTVRTVKIVAEIPDRMAAGLSFRLLAYESVAHTGESCAIIHIDEATKEVPL
jgi:hypothetical protein